MARASQAEKNQLLTLQNDPIAFVQFYMPDLLLWSGMKMILDSVWTHQRTSVRAAHGLSKTICAAIAAVVFLNTHPDSVVITTAPTNRQVEFQLWKEINAIYRQYGHLLLGNCLTKQCKISEEWFLYGFSTDQATNVEGHHASAILWVLDEAKGLPQWLYDAVEGSMTGGVARVLEISTTDGADQQCPLRQHHTTKSSKWNCIKFSAWDSPFVDRTGYAKYRQHFNRDLEDYGRPKRKREWPEELESSIQITTKGWVDDRRDDWEETEPGTFQTKVCGDFASMAESAVIPLEWIEAASGNSKVKPNPKVTKFGLDVAEFGDDKNVLFERQGKFVFKPMVWTQIDSMELAGKVIVETQRRGTIHIDKIGIGAGPFWRLNELGHPVIGVESAGKAQWDDEEQFYNLRAEMWWHARAVFLRNYKEGNALSIPDDAELKEELSGIKYKFHSDGRILIEAKKDFKKRLGRSPDKGDAFVYCLARLHEPIREEIPKEFEAIMMR